MVGYCFSSFQLVIWSSPARRTEMARRFNPQSLAERGEEMNLQKRSYTTQERIPIGLPPPENTIVETIVCEEFDDGWGSYSDPDVSMH